MWVTHLLRRPWGREDDEFGGRRSSLEIHSPPELPSCITVYVELFPVSILYLGKEIIICFHSVVLGIKEVNM